MPGGVPAYRIAVIPPEGRFRQQPTHQSSGPQLDRTLWRVDGLLLAFLGRVGRLCGTYLAPSHWLGLLL